MNKETCSLVLFLFLSTFAISPTYTLASTANITQINFTSVQQTIDINVVSGQLTTQTQNSAGALEQLDTSGTVLELSSSSATGVFYNANASACTTLLTEPFRLTMSNGSANKNFCYKDSTAGIHTLTITVQGKSWTAAVQNITINPPPDTTAPVITLTGANPQIIEVNDSYSELGATVSDNVDTGLSATIDTSALNVNVLGNYSVTYDAVDSSSNPATQVARLVNVVDTTKPVIALIGSVTINSIVGDTYAEQGATVSDNYDAGPTVTVGGDSVNTTATGTYTITFNAVDSSGNTADQITRTVMYGPVPPSSAAGSAVSGGAVVFTAPASISSPAVSSSPAISTPTTPAVADNSAIPSDSAPAIAPQTIVSHESPIPKSETASLSEKNLVVAKAETQTALPEAKEEIPPEALLASAVNALPEPSSNKITITIGTISGILLLASIWKLKLIK